MMISGRGSDPVAISGAGGTLSDQQASPKRCSCCGAAGGLTGGITRGWLMPAGRPGGLVPAPDIATGPLPRPDVIIIPSYDSLDLFRSTCRWI